MGQFVYTLGFIRIPKWHTVYIFTRCSTNRVTLCMFCCVAFAYLRRTRYEVSRYSYICRPYGIHFTCPGALGEQHVNIFACPGTPGEQDSCIFTCPGAPGEQDVCSFTCPCDPGEQEVSSFMCPGAAVEQDVCSFACPGARPNKVIAGSKQ